MFSADGKTSSGSVSQAYGKPRPDPRMYVGTGFDEPLFISVPEERPVVDIRLRGEGSHVPFRVPGIDVRVKVDDGDRAVHGVEGFEDWEDLQRREERSSEMPQLCYENGEAG